MDDMDKVIEGLKFCTQHGPMCGSDCNGHYERYTDDGYVIKLVDEYRSKCPYGKCETGCVKTLAKDALELLKEQEAIVIKRPKKLDEIYDYVAHCPECHMQWAMDDSERMRYCPGCGRRVKWDD